MEVSLRCLRGFCAVSALLQFSQGLVHVLSIHLHESEEREEQGEKDEPHAG